MAVELVDCHIISSAADLQGPPEPASYARLVRRIVYVVEQSSSSKYFFAACIVADLEINSGLGISLPQLSECRCVHYEIAQPVIGKHQYPLYSNLTRRYSRPPPKAQLQPTLNGNSCRCFQYLFDCGHLTSIYLSYR